MSFYSWYPRLDHRVLGFQFFSWLPGLYQSELLSCSESSPSRINKTDISVNCSILEMNQWALSCPIQENHWSRLLKKQAIKFKSLGRVKNEFLPLGAGTRNVSIYMEYLPVEICWPVVSKDLFPKMVHCGRDPITHRQGSNMHCSLTPLFTCPVVPTSLASTFAVLNWCVASELGIPVWWHFRAAGVFPWSVPRASGNHAA